jgi:hypothetical protein
MTQARGRRSLGANLLLIAAIVVLAVLGWKLEKAAQDWLWQFFSHISPWMLWVLAVVVPSIPVIYTVIVWWHARDKKSAHELREDV